jgi:hypothetical protein
MNAPTLEPLSRSQVELHLFHFGASNTITLLSDVFNLRSDDMKQKINQLYNRQKQAKDLGLL